MPEPYSGPNRRTEMRISEDEVERIAERAAKIAVEHSAQLIAERAAELAVQKLATSMYQMVGKSVVEKAFYIIGALSLAAYLYAQNRGWIK